MNERPLANCAVNLSISEGEDSESLGFPVWQVNRVTLQVTASLIGQGATIVFGHDWREDGVMQAVHGFALQVQAPVPQSPTDAKSADHPLLRNILPWPDKPHLSHHDLERLASTLRVQRAGLPPEVVSREDEALKSGAEHPLYRYLRARGLTHLRHQLNTQSHARFCIGGRTDGYAGRYPGIIEEALLAVYERKPLFLVGFLGGATRQVIGAIEGHDIPDRFCLPTQMEAIFKDPPVPENDPKTQSDRLYDRTAVWRIFKETGISGLSQNNRLSPEENRELFYTPVLDRAIELLLTGLSRLNQRDR